MEITIKEKKYTVKEIPYIKAIELDANDKGKMVRDLFSACTGMTEEEIASLTISEGKKVEEAIVSVNNLDTQNFQSPITKNE